MRRIRKKIKRSFAMILTVCMVLTSFQGIAFADPDLDSSAKERDVLFELDGTALKTEAEEAIRSGAFYNAQVGFQELLETSDEEDPIKFVDSNAYADIFDQSTGSIYQLQDIPYAREASASDAMYEDAELQIFVKLNGQAAEAATQSNARKASDSSLTEESDSEMEKASGSDLRKPSANDTIIDTENYEMNGDEKLIFLFINRSNDDLTFQLDIDGRKSALVQVESKNVLLATDQEEEETPAPSTDEEVNKGQENQGSTEENDGNGTTGNGTTENGSGSTSTEENENKDTTVEGGNQGSEENSGNTTENTAPSTDNKEENKGQENQGGNEGNKETIVEIENQGSKDNSGDTTENKAPSVANKGENKAQENQGSNEGNTGNSTSGSGSTEGGSSTDTSSNSNTSEKGEDQQVSISSHRIERVMAFVPQDSYDDDDEDAPKSPEEEFEMMGEDDEEEEEVDDETYNDDVDVYTSDVEGVDIPAEVYPVVLMKRKSRSLFRMIRARGNAKAAEASAGLMVMSVSALQPVAIGDFVPLVDFYDYWDSPKALLYNNDDVGFNAAIVEDVKKKKKTLKDTQTFSLYSNGSNRDLRRLKNDKKAPWQDICIAQNLVVDTYNVESMRAHIKKEFGPHTTMFPVDSVYEKNNKEVYKLENDAFKDGIRWYPNVEFPGFKSITDNEKGYTKYVFDAMKTPVRRDASTSDYKNNLKLKVINSSSNGFWPFNTVAKPENMSKEQKKYSFGMHMSVPFYLPLNGCYGENGNVPLTFTFKGDDDVWVYLKEVDPTNNTFTSRLVLDLGGIHGSCTGTINFATGYASVSPDTNDIIKINDDGSYENLASVGGRAVKVKLKDLGIENGKFYSLEFFYMERNPTESNCYIEIGLPVTPAGTLQITKEVKGISLTDEKVNKDYEFEVRESDDHNTWNKLENNITINPTNNKTKSITTTTTKWYRVKEIDPKDDSTASWTGSGKLTDDGWYEVKVEPEKGATVVCTNKYSANSLQITKKMSGNSLPGNLAANFKVTINNSNGKTIKIRKPDDSGNLTEESKTVNSNEYSISDIALKNNEKCIISGLDANSTYKVEETGITDENYKYDAQIQSGGDGKNVEVNNGNKIVTGGFQEKEDGSSHVNFTFTNAVERKNKVLTLTKKLSGFMELRPSTDQKYTFELLKRKGAAWKKFEDFTFADTPAKADKTIEITGAGSVTLLIDPEKAGGTFWFKETGEGDFNSDATSWKFASNPGSTYEGKDSPRFSFSDKTEFEVTCTNTYNVNRTLTVEKKLTDNSANVTGTFGFNAVFKGNNDAILSIPYEITSKAADGTVSSNSGTLTDSANAFNLAPGDKITFSKIPNGVSYQITETGTNTVENSEWYDIRCTGAVVESVKDDDSKENISSATNATISGSFVGEENRNQMVTFTNSVTVKTGKLKITKKIVENATSDQAVKADDNLTFTFKVTKTPGGMNEDKSFYVSVPVIKGNFKGFKEIEVPVGVYQIEEMPYLQYEAVEKSKMATVEVGDEPASTASVEFKNYRSADGYFTDSKVTVNTVIKDDKFHFHSEDTSKPKSKIRQIAALITNGSKTEDDDDNEN